MQTHLVFNGPFILFLSKERLFKENPDYIFRSFDVNPSLSHSSGHVDIWNQCDDVCQMLPSISPLTSRDDGWENLKWGEEEIALRSFRDFIGRNCKTKLIIKISFKCFFRLVNFIKSQFQHVDIETSVDKVELFIPNTIRILFERERIWKLHFSWNDKCVCHFVFS